MSAAGLLTGLLAAPAAADASVERVGGGDRVTTATAVSARVLPDCPASGCPAVVVAQSGEPVDALAGAPLAAQLGASLLLTGRAGLDADTEREVRRLGARRAVLLGGTVALSAQVEADLTAAGVERVERVAGVTRYATAAAVAELLAPDGVVVIRSGPGLTSPDAAAAGVLAAAGAGAVLLVERDAVPRATREALRQIAPRSVTVVGGEASVSARAADELAEVAEVGVDRIAGATRYDTSALVARRAADLGADAGTVFVADGGGGSDALVAGAAAALRDGVLLLIDGGDPSASPAALDHLTGHRPILRELVLVGGRAVLPDATLDQVREVIDTAGRPFEFYTVEIAVGAESYSADDPVTFEITTCNSQDRQYVLTYFQPRLKVEVVDQAGAVVADNIVGVNYVYGNQRSSYDPRQCKVGRSTWEQQTGPLHPEQSDTEPGPRAMPGIYRIKVQERGEEENAPGVSYPPVYSDPFILE